MRPVETRDRAAMGLLLCDQRPFSRIRQIPDAHKAIARAGYHSSSIRIKGYFVDVIQVHGIDDLRRRMIPSSFR
jgi:hypothetical protein